MENFIYFALICCLSAAPLVHGVGPGETCHPSAGPYCDDDLNSYCEQDPPSSGNYICICVRNFFNYNGACTSLPTLPSHPCHEIEAPCDAIHNTECVGNPTSKTCTCINTYSHDTVNRRCILTPTQPGDICQRTSVPCTFDPTEVACGPVRPEYDGESICECLNGKVTDVPNHRCLTRPENPGDSCTQTLTPCTGVVNTTCSPKSGGDWHCACNGDLVLQPDLQKCLFPPNRVGDLCDPIYNLCGRVEDTSCAQNETSQDVCICLDPLVTDYFAGKCLMKPGFPGDQCHTELTPCSDVPLTECGSDKADGTETYCKCDEGYVTLPGEKRCLIVPILPGEECHVTLAPCVGVNNTMCMGNKCICVGDLITDEEFGRCLNIPEEATDSCHPMLAPCNRVAHTTCAYSIPEDEYKCACMAGYVLNPANKSCLAIPTRPGDPCDTTLPLPCTGVTNATTCFCEGGSNCYCKCDGDLINDPDQARCLSRPQFPLDLCHPGVADCSLVENTICARPPGETEFECLCISGYVYDLAGKRCISPPVQPGDPCEPSLAPCTNFPNTTCTWTPEFGYSCRCVGGLITEDGTCFKVPEFPGDRCSLTQAPCVSVTNTSCLRDGHFSYTWCKCGDGFFTDFSARRCIPLPEKPGQICLPGSDQCDKIPHTECRPGAGAGGDSYLCECIEGYFQSGEEECVALATKPLDPCEEDVHCAGVPGSECGEGRTCICIPAEYDLSPGGTQCLAKADELYEKCEFDAQCSKMNNSYCPPGINRTCVCHVGYFPSETLKFCLLPVTRIGATCLENIQCEVGIGVESRCGADSTCECKEGFVPTEGGNGCVLVS